MNKTIKNTSRNCDELSKLIGAITNQQPTSYYNAKNSKTTNVGANTRKYTSVITTTTGNNNVTKTNNGNTLLISNYDNTESLTDSGNSTLGSSGGDSNNLTNSGGTSASAGAGSGDTSSINNCDIAENRQTIRISDIKRDRGLGMWERQLSENTRKACRTFSNLLTECHNANADQRKGIL